MMWFFIIISAYFLLAVCGLIDKHLLTGPIPQPKVYAFYIGVIGILAVLLIPFIDFYIPALPDIFLSFLAGFMFLYALFWLYKSLHLFEASRVIPAIGGLVPLFTFGLIYVFSLGREVLSFSEISAFIFLVLGSVLITFRKEKFITLKVLRYSTITAFLFSFSFVLTKYVYLSQPFWNGYVWMRIGGFLAALGFLVFAKEIKKEILKPRVSLLSFLLRLPKTIRTAGIFLFNKGLGTTANILQNFAIALAPLGYVAIINALQGVQYVFLLILAILISFKFPLILKEEVSKRVIFQKILAVLFIATGLGILFLQ